MAARARGGSMVRMVTPSKGLPERYSCGRKRERKALGGSTTVEEDVHDRIRIMLGLLESKPVLIKSGREVVRGLHMTTAASACKRVCAIVSLWDVGGISVICN